LEADYDCLVNILGIYGGNYFDIHQPKGIGMIELIGIVSMILAIAGVILNNRRLRICFIVWIISNSLTLIIHICSGIYSLAVRDLVFLILAFEGWFLWKAKY